MPVLSLRRAFIYVTILVTTLALFIAAMLVLISSYLDRSSASFAGLLERVRLAQDAKVGLLLHSRARDPLVRRELEGNLRDNFERLRRYRASSEDEGMFRRADEAITRYLVDPESGDAALGGPEKRLDTAYRALDALVLRSSSESRLARDRINRLNGLATMLGVGTALLLLILTMVFLWWLITRAFKPVFLLNAAIERFAQGDWSTKAPEWGPLEFRGIAQQFNQMAALLVAQREAQTAFLTGVAHDLRNPLSALRTSIVLIGPDKPLPPEPRLRQMLGVIHRQINHLERMIGDFVDRSMIESGKLDLQLDLVDARNLLHDATELFRDCSPRHAFRLEVPEQSVIVRCDPMRLEQILVNLISNAVKYSPAGGTIRIRLAREDEEAVLAITDPGIGIPKEHQARLFEPFHRLSLSHEAIPGVGLGLFVVRRIVEAHGGRIEVVSSPGRGSTFRVFLPLATESATT